MRKSYSSEFKLKAASMVLDEGQPVTEVCASLDIGPTALRRWVDQVRKERLGSTPVFYNTRLAKVWDSAQEQTKASVLIERARREGYSLGAMPAAVMMITGAVDVQADRLEFMAMGWA